MKFLTDEKLLIVGAAGMIGSNMAQTAACLGLSSNICLYDIFEPGLKGVLAEMDHCAFEGVNFTAGLPIVRTSPDHGTAYDMAGRDEADPHSMMSSIFTAIDIFKSRQAYDALQAGKMNKEK